MKEVVPGFNELIAALDASHRPHSSKSAPKAIEPIRDMSGWSLHKKGEALHPLSFSNTKTQEDVVREVVGHIKNGVKTVFIHGVCGTGKSAIALNIARQIGRTSLVVPVRELQRQYESDYMGSMHVLKPNGLPLRIAMITGRENHASLFSEGTCADPSLPELIRFTERNTQLIHRYYSDNPFSSRNQRLSLKELKRLSIAPANPYWSPILPAHFDPHLSDAEKKRYKGLGGKEFIFYHRKKGCSYYDQYQAYIDADVIIFNAAKYKIELALDRKPETAVDIIDEADEFLDNFSEQHTLNLTRFSHSLGMIRTSTPELFEVSDQLREIVSKLERTYTAFDIDEKAIQPVNDTPLGTLLSVLSRNKELADEAQVDEASYLAHALEVARDFEHSLKDSYVSFYRNEKDLYANLVTSNLSRRFSELRSKTNALVFMSGTLHEATVLKKVFGVGEYAFVEAETMFPGSTDIIRTGLERDCRYSQFSAGAITREHYLKALDACVAKAPRPTLVHVNAFEDLPSIQETFDYGLRSLQPREALREHQQNDREGSRVARFKKGEHPLLFTTKCTRGVDFPGKLCNSVVFTKYPNPNPGDIFWKVLERTHKDQFWDMYRDKARREFLQRLYRALRFKEDHVFVLSPDTRVLEAVSKLQRSA
jgi:Rad3-related DNA helicase